MEKRQGILLLVSGPSGAGKTTLCTRLEEAKEAYYAISCTTRKPRPGETDGDDYFFLDVASFQQKINEGAFIEYAEVHGNYYGTLKSEVISHLENGNDVVMDIDVQGAASVRACTDEMIQASLVDLFVTPENEIELRKRLENRQTDDPAIIEKRMQNSLAEMAESTSYTYLMVSSDKDTDYNQFISLLKTERLRQSRMYSE